MKMRGIHCIIDILVANLFKELILHLLIHFIAIFLLSLRFFPIFGLFSFFLHFFFDSIVWILWTIFRRTDVTRWIWQGSHFVESSHLFFECLAILLIHRTDGILVEYFIFIHFYIFTQLFDHQNIIVLFLISKFRWLFVVWFNHVFKGDVDS